MSQSGFSSVEVLVSVGIMLTIMSVIIFNQSGYLDSAALSNLADEIASKVVQSQAYGVAVREIIPGSADFSAAYGLAFSILNSGSNTAYLDFADRNSNSIYDGDWNCGSSECLQKNDILRGDYIDDICVIRSNGGDQCNAAKRVDISFLRPAVEARVIFFNSGGGQWNPPNAIGAKIKLKSPGNLTRSISVYQSGQVSSQ